MAICAVGIFQQPMGLQLLSLTRTTGPSHTAAGADGPFRKINDGSPMGRVP